MNDTRKKLLERVRAIMAKTLSNGCTEGEAMLALEKARELMAAYDISEAELGVTQEQESARVYKDATDDRYRIKSHLLYPVGKFTRCRPWTGSRYSDYRVAFCGLESDVDFATWLLEMLQRFVLRELKAFQAERRAQGLACPRIISSSFVHGCVERIAERLRELAPPEPVGEATNALVVSRQALISKALSDAGIKLVKGRRRSSTVSPVAYKAGIGAGNAARFDRPVGGGGKLRLA